MPVSLVGSFHHLRTEEWILRPTTITVHLHDTIETKGLHKEDVPALKERVRQIIAAPVEASLGETSASENAAARQAALED